jgi:hypothetical protein
MRRETYLSDQPHYDSMLFGLADVKSGAILNIYTAWFSTMVLRGFIDSPVGWRDNVLFGREAPHDP